MVPTVERGLRLRRALLDRDRRRQPLDRVDVGLAHLLEELPRVGGERLDVAPLPLGVERVEGERRLARARQAGDHDQPIARDPHVEVGEVVLARAADLDVGRRVRCASSGVPCAAWHGSGARRAPRLPDRWRLGRSARPRRSSRAGRCRCCSRSSSSHSRYFTSSLRFDRPPRCSASCDLLVGQRLRPSRAARRAGAPSSRTAAPGGRSRRPAASGSSASRIQRRQLVDGQPAEVAAVLRRHLGDLLRHLLERLAGEHALARLASPRRRPAALSRACPAP